MLNLSKPKFVFVSAYAAKKAIEVCKSLAFVEKVILITGDTVDDYVVSLKDFISKSESISFNIEEHTTKKVDMDDQVALIMSSSGTTGLPKGVMITQTNLKSSVDGYREIIGIVKGLHGVDSFRILNITPLFHVLGYMWLFVFACCADPISVLLPRFEEKAFLEAVQVIFIKID